MTTTRPFDFDVILFDQGRTFMFENDRFGAGIDYHATYQRLGGTRLARDQVRSLVQTAFEHLSKVYRDPQWYDRFPSVAEAIHVVSRDEWPTDELERFDELFACHEVGKIVPEDSGSLRRLCARHRLGLVSNIWAKPDHFISNLKAHDVHDCFEHLVWSSAEKSIKPSPRLYLSALERFQVRPDRAVYVGDDPMRDIDGAKRAGLAAVWVRNQASPLQERYLQPDWTIDTLRDLEALASGL